MNFVKNTQMGTLETFESMTQCITDFTKTKIQFQKIPSWSSKLISDEFAYQSLKHVFSFYH